MLCCLAALWCLVPVWYWTKCWHLAEVVTVTVMTANPRPSTELSEAWFRPYDTLSKRHIPLDQFGESYLIRSSHALNLAFGTWWADHPPSPFKVPLRCGLAAPWKWRVQGHSHCARRPIVHVHVHSFVILTNCRTSASISSNEKALWFTPYGPITHAEQARVSQKGACSFTFTNSNCSRVANIPFFSWRLLQSHVRA